MEWNKIICKSRDLQLIPILSGGQSFRWQKSKENIWTGVFAHKVWFLKQDADSILYKVFEPVNVKGMITPINCNKELLKNYFRLDVNLEEMYTAWSNADSNFEQAAKIFYGIRILKQDLVENIFSFICSSNNNIKRISGMVEKLCRLYGDKICDVDGVTFYDFPNVDKLTDTAVEKKLRDSGFGYRAKYIHASASKIVEMGNDLWLSNLKKMKYKEAKLELMKLTGIGAKVADCICLMSLGHLESIPVDTHIFQVASQHYLPHLKNCKSVTDKVYNEIGDYFRQKFGDKAGWAHTILFCADLKMFEDNSESVKKKRKK